MDKDYFMNSGNQFVNTMATWNSLSSAQEVNCLSEQPMDCFMNLNWDKSNDQYNHFDSSLSSMVSSPVATNSPLSNDRFALRELIGKLGNNNNNSTSSSCFTTPLNSPPKLTMPMMDQVMNENFPSIRNSVPSSPVLPSIPVVDPGFAERAAKFSCFGSRSFNGRTNQLGFNNAELSIRSNAPLGRLPRVSSSPSLKQGGSPMEINNSSQPQMEIRPNNGFASGSDRNLSKLSGSGANSNQQSSVFEQVQNGDTGLKLPGESNSRKRKAVSKGKAPSQAAEADDNAYPKRIKPTESNGNEKIGSVKAEEEKSNGGNESEKQEKANQKLPEPPKDYIHVRARRGQATDSHSLAERVRREKIGERMKLLQDLVPGCNKVTGKALMLDEIINYVQAMQRQVEFLSMKLSSVNPRMDFDMNNLMSKDMYQPNASLPPPLCSLDSSAAAFFSHQPQPTLQLHSHTSNGSVNGFGEGLPQFHGQCEDDLQSIVHMGFNQNPNRDPEFHSQRFLG